MNKRETLILAEIVSFSEKNNKEIQQKLNISERQLEYSLTQINLELFSQGIPKIIHKKNGSFDVSDRLFDYFANHARLSMNVNDYYDQRQRIYFIILYILTSQETISLPHIYSLINVSRSTASNDLKRVKGYLNERNLELNYTRQNGYFISGKELIQRNLLNDLIGELNKYTDLLVFVENYSRISLDQVIHYAKKVEEKVEVVYSDDAFQTLTYLLLFNILRNISGRERDKKYFQNKIKDTREYEVVSQLTDSKYIRSDSDYEWLTLIFLSSNTIHSNLNPLDSEILRAVKSMVDKFEEKTLVKISDRKDFDERLLVHLRPAIFRVKYGLHLNNTGLDDFIVGDTWQEYLVEIVEKIIFPLEKLTGVSFPTIELKLISFYFGGELEKSKGQFLDIHQRAAVVCTNGIISARLMYENLIRLFPEITFLATNSVREFENFNQDYDIVFSTVPLKTEARQYLIKPVISTEEAVQLRYRVLDDLGLEKRNNSIDELLDIISKNTKITNLNSLKEDLNTWLVSDKTSGNSSQKNEQLPPLNQFLKRDYIQIIKKDMLWEEAVKVACTPLKEKKLVNENFLQSLVAQIADPKNYSFLGNQIAIPHTTPNNGVLGNGFGFCIFKKPIKFPGGESISIIVPIAVKDTTTHLKAIMQLSEFAENKKDVKNVLHAKDIDEIYKIIKKYC